MIWLIGNRGMLGSDVETLLTVSKIPFFATDSEVDITSFETLNNFAKDKELGWIINCAAYTAVEKAESNKEAAFTLNSLGPENISKIAKSKDAKLIHISTDYVFDGRKDSAYLETDNTNPINVYGASKLEGEQNIQKTWPKHFIIRTAWLYSSHGSNFVNTMIRLFNTKPVVTVVSDQFGSPTYSKDLAEVIVKIIFNNSDLFGTYNYTNGGKTSWNDFALEIETLALKHGLIDKKVDIKKVSTEEYPTQITRPLNLELSKEKIKEVFEIEVRDWKEALEECIMEKL